MNRTALAAFIVFVITIVIFTISKDFVLFWDTIQFAGYHPLYYYESEFSSFFLPNHLDSGHIPTFGLYVAGVWKILGRSLWSSHLAMAPFVFLCLWHSYRLGAKWIPKKPWIYPLLIICIPQCISQLMLVSPDVVLLSFFLGLLLSLENKKGHFIIAHSIGLVMISNRGFILLIGIVIWLLLRDWKKKEEIKSLTLFIPALFVFICYQFFHWLHIGWIGTHSEMPWSGSFSILGLGATFKNVMIYTWRLLDFGVIIIWIIMGYYFIKNSKKLIHKKHFQLLLILIFLFGAITIPFNGLMQHRYFIPIQVLAGFILLKWISTYEMTQNRIKNIVNFILIFLLLGNVWIYPDKIAQGWDSTLAHLPYYPMQKEVDSYLDEYNIDKLEVATAFPLRSPQNVLNANDDLSQYQNKDDSQTNFILYSNVMNDFSDEEIELYSTEWNVVKQWRKYRIKMILYKRP